MARSEAPWPKAVRQLVDHLHEMGWGTVEVSGSPGGKWEVAVEGEHVRATAGFEFRLGKTRQVAGTMRIDGEPAPLAEDYQDLRRIWDEHEGTAAPEPGAAPAVLMEIHDPGRAPVPRVVEFAAEKMTAGDPDLQFEVRTGLTEGGHWAVGVDLPDGAGLRLVFTRYARNIWELDRTSPIQIVVGGVDRSSEVDGDIEKAMAVLLRRDPRPPADSVPGSSAVGRRETGRPTTGVATRKMVVIRN
jgi:hypothetical protein